MKGSFQLHVHKQSVVALNEDMIGTQLNRLCKKTIGTTLERRGWKAQKPSWEKAERDHGYLYSATVPFRKITPRKFQQITFDRESEDIARKFLSGGRSLGWYAEKEDTQLDGTESRATEGYNVVLPDDISPFFQHIFGRDAQIRLISSSIASALATEFKVRNHVLCFGPPAGAKTETVLAFEQVIGPQNVIRLDATSMTKAGVENLLLEMETIPPILLIEEIEKCNPINLPWLLGILDQRGEIIKTNARVGSLRKEARCLCIATVNDYAGFKSIMSGALESRFQHKIYFPRPSRAILEKILLREVAKINGNPEWVNPVLDYALDVEKTNDTRRIISLLDGRDKLLTGEYQRDLTEMLEAMRMDQEGE